MKASDIRPVVIDYVLRFPRTQLVNIKYGVEEKLPDFKPSDELILGDVIWELLIQGVLAPGANSSNLDLPHLHLTDYGRHCLSEDSILPHDPDGYMVRLRKKLPTQLDGTVEQYVAESLSTFLGGQFLASTVMLGVASERCVDLLTDAYQSSQSDNQRQGNFEKKLKQTGRSVKARFDLLRSELQTLQLPAELSDSLDIQLAGIFTVIRYSRNDAGHATGRVIDRDLAHANLLLFPQYCLRVYQLIGFLS